MVFQKRSSRQDHKYKFHLDTVALEHTKSYTYLGQNINTTGNFHKAVDDLRNKARMPSKGSLSQSAVPTCFKRATIVPVPKKAKVTELNDCRPIALISVIMKCFERLVKYLITSTLPGTLGPLPFAYRPNRSTYDAIRSEEHTSELQSL